MIANPSRAVLGLLLLCVPAARAALPPDLEAVPRGAAGFVHVRAADVWQSEPFTELRHYISKAGPDALKDFQKMFAPNPADIERVTVVFMTVESMMEPTPEVDPEAVSALVIVACKNPIDRARLLKQLEARDKKYGQRVYHFNEELWSGLLVLDDKTFVFGSEDALIQFIDQSAKGNGPLTPALEEAAKTHLAVLGLNPSVFAKHELAKGVPPDLQPLLQAGCISAALDFDAKLKLQLKLDFAQPAQAQAGEKAFRALLELARLGLGMAITQVDAELRKKVDQVEITDMPARFGMLLAAGFLRDLDELIKKAPVERKDTVVSYRLDYDKKLLVRNGGLGSVFMAASWGAMRKFGAFMDFGGREDPTAEEKRLRKLVAALEKYQKDKGHYPPAALYDQSGTPLLSWRVALLPYMGEEALYKQFKLDEPWDSLHNKKLIKKMPAALKAVGTRNAVIRLGGEEDEHAPKGGRRLKTTDLVFTGANTAFEGKTGLKPADIDGNTILLVSVGSGELAVYWTKPADLKYERGQPLPEVFGRYQSPLHVMLKNGTHKAIEAEKSDELKDLIERKKK